MGRAGCGTERAGGAGAVADTGERPDEKNAPSIDVDTTEAVPGCGNSSAAGAEVGREAGGAERARAEAEEVLRGRGNGEHGEVELHSESARAMIERLVQENRRREEEVMACRQAAAAAQQAVVVERWVLLMRGGHGGGGWSSGYLRIRSDSSKKARGRGIAQRPHPSRFPSHVYVHSSGRVSFRTPRSVTFFVHTRRNGRLCLHPCLQKP
jgi:hypothetical protein